MKNQTVLWIQFSLTHCQSSTQLNSPETQITRYGSPCLDLGYYFLTSIKPEVRRVHYKDLLKIYYDQFVETSKLMENKCPITFEVRTNQIYSAQLFGRN